MVQIQAPEGNREKKLKQMTRQVQLRNNRHHVDD